MYSKPQAHIGNHARTSINTSDEPRIFTRRIMCLQYIHAVDSAVLPTVSCCTAIQDHSRNPNASECKLSELACLPQQLFSPTTRIGVGRMLVTLVYIVTILACCETYTFTLAEDGGFHSGASIPLLPHVIKTRHPHQQTRPARESLRLRRVRASRIRRSWAGIQNIVCLGHFRRSFRWVHRVSHQSRRQRCP